MRALWQHLVFSEPCLLQVQPHSGVLHFELMEPFGERLDEVAIDHERTPKSKLAQESPESLHRAARQTNNQRIHPTVQLRVQRLTRQPLGLTGCLALLIARLLLCEPLVSLF